MTAYTPTPAPKTDADCWPFGCAAYHETWAHTEGDDPCACRCHSEVRTYIAHRADETLSYGDIAYAQSQGWCPSSPDGMGSHRPDETTDPVTCAECGAEVPEVDGWDRTLPDRSASA